MNSMLRRSGAAALTGLLVLVGFGTAAQPVFPARNPFAAPFIPPNPNFQVAPGLSVSQAAFNTAILGRALRQIPPYALGYNPYAAPAVASVPYMAPLGGYSPTLATYPGMGAGGYPSTATLTTNPVGGYDPGTAAPGYGGYGAGPYGGYGTEDPTAGFLRGSADVVNATGNYYKNVQSARLIQTQADESRIDYRRRLIDEARYERMNLMTSEEIRQQNLARDLSRARHEPPIEDIASAKSLNDLLHHLINDPNRPKGQNIPLDEDVLRRVNVTSPTQASASVGLLRDDGNLQWPQSLLGHEFDTAREHLGKSLAGVVAGLKFNNAVKPGDIRDLNADLDQLSKSVEKSELSVGDYIAARDYLSQVGSAIRALQDPNVANYFNHKFNAKNVAELVDDMRTKGLDFAAAAPGDEGAYRALHQALVAYDYSIAPTQPTAAPKPTPPQEEPARNP